MVPVARSTFSGSSPIISLIPRPVSQPCCANYFYQYKQWPPHTKLKIIYQDLMTLEHELISHYTFLFHRICPHKYLLFLLGCSFIVEQQQCVVLEISNQSFLFLLYLLPLWFFILFLCLSIWTSAWVPRVHRNFKS